MSRKKLGRVMIAAAKSGSGKTLITCGILSYLKNNGTGVKCYKCGPDYIDPMFHRQVLGVSGGNLDSYFADDNRLRQILASTVENTAVLEGVMGIYDGLGGTEVIGSCYDVARATATPIILVVDAYGSGRTVMSVVRGIIEDDTEGLIRAVILNRITGNFYESIKQPLQEMLGEVALLGYVEKIKDVNIESRHLGLKQPWEIENINDQIKRVEDAIAATLDMERLKLILSNASDIEYEPEQNIINDAGLTLAVARDEAFCFYYEENLQMLRDRGVSIVEFSPIRDERIPANANGLLLGGGYPELFLEELGANESMKLSIADAISNGMPSLAECGGFMYLHKAIVSEDRSYPMVGIIDGECGKQERLVRFGYMELSGNELVNGLKGHEFHYYDSSNNGSDALATKPVSGRNWSCMHTGENFAWGFPHLYYPSCEQFINKFIIKMQEYAFMN